MALLLLTGVRHSDVVHLDRQHDREEWFHSRQFKNRNRNPVDIEMPILPDLKRIIDATPTGDLTYVVTSFGVPFSMAGFGNSMRERCDEVCRPECSAHGLRKAARPSLPKTAPRCTSSMSSFGWLTAKETARHKSSTPQKNGGRRDVATPEGQRMNEASHLDAGLVSNPL